MSDVTDPNDAARLASLQSKVATYEGVLFTIASMRTDLGDMLTKMSLINAVNGAKTVMGLGTEPPAPHADAQSKVAVLQAEVRASRNAISVSVGKFQLMTVCGGNAIDDLSKARAETDQQGALT